ncbi:MAG: cell wall-binding repeat-containing protein [Actinomycetota bacterium]|jgi:putative cell wall-binding protein|nr:cell wall-binding repeat-containing protein [Actinomycetota bacterium]
MRKVSEMGETMKMVRFSLIWRALASIAVVSGLVLQPLPATATNTTPQANPALPASPVVGTLAEGETMTYNIDFAMSDWAEYYFRCWVYGPDGSKINVYLLDEGEIVIGCQIQAYPDGFSFTPPSGGYAPVAAAAVETYQLEVRCEEGPGDFTLHWEIRNRDEGLTERIAGPSRIQTSVLCSKKGFPHGASTVIVATAYNWPDALSASGLAGAVRGPLLLTHSDYLDADVLAEIQRLGASKVYIIGGSIAVSDQVETALKSELGDTAVTRVSGASRYETSAEVAREMKAFMISKGRSIDSWAYLSTGANYPDALAVGPIAAAMVSPVILEPPSGGLSFATRALLQELGCDNAILLGGTNAMPEAKEIDLVDMFGADYVLRLGGASRYETAATVATFGVLLGMNPDGAAVVTGTGYADALSAAMMQASSTSVLLLAPNDGTLGDPTRAFFRSIGPVYLTHARIVGGFGGAALESELSMALTGF